MAVLDTQPQEWSLDDRPEVNEMDDMIEHLMRELQGRKVLEKARVSKKTMVAALRQQTSMVGTLKHTQTSQFTLLDDRTKRTGDQVDGLLERTSRQEIAVATCSAKLAGMDGVISSLQLKLDDMDNLIDLTKSLKQQVVELQNTVVAQFEQIRSLKAVDAKLDDRVCALENGIRHIPGSAVYVSTSEHTEAVPLSQVVKDMHDDMSLSQERIQKHTQLIRLHGEQIENKADADIKISVELNREDIDELKIKMTAQEEVDVQEIRRTQISMNEQLDVVQQELMRKIDKSYVDEHVEAKYEEIIEHLQKALASTEEDEEDFKASTKSLQSLVEQLSTCKADRRELLELKQLVMSIDSSDRRSIRSNSITNIGAGEGVSGAITRDEVFNLLEEKVDKKDLERRLLQIMRSIHAFKAMNASSKGAGAGTPAQRGGDPSIQHDTGGTSLPEGALAMSKSLMPSMGMPIGPAGPAMGMCLSCKAPIVHPDRLDLFPGSCKGGGFHLWATHAKGPPLRQMPVAETLPGLLMPDDQHGRHIIGKDGNLYLAAVHSTKLETLSLVNSNASNGFDFPRPSSASR